MVSSYSLISGSFVHNSMYTGAMEPFCLNRGTPGGEVLAGRLVGNKAPTSGGLDTRGYNTDHHPSERLLACKLSGYV